MFFFVAHALFFSRNFPVLTLHSVVFLPRSGTCTLNFWFGIAGLNSSYASALLIFFALRRRACPVFAPTGPPWMLWDRGPVREVTITVVPPAARPRHALCWSRKLRPSSTAGAGEEASEQEQQQQRRQQQRQARLCQMVFKHASEALSFEEAFAAVCENPIGQQRKVSLWHVLTSVLKPMPHRLLWSILVGRCGRCAASVWCWTIGFFLLI